MATEDRSGSGQEIKQIIKTEDDLKRHIEAETGLKVKTNLKQAVPTCIDAAFLTHLGEVYSFLLKYPETPPFRRELAAMFKTVNDLVAENMALRKALALAEDRTMQIINGFFVESWKEQAHTPGINTGHFHYRPHPMEAREIADKLSDGKIIHAAVADAQRKEEENRPHPNLLKANDRKFHPVIVQVGFMEREAEQIKKNALSLMGK